MLHIPRLLPRRCPWTPLYFMLAVTGTDVTPALPNPRKPNSRRTRQDNTQQNSRRLPSMLDVNDFITERGGNPEQIRYDPPPQFAGDLSVSLRGTRLTDRTQGVPATPKRTCRGCRRDHCDMGRPPQDPLRCHAAEQQDQRDPEGDRPEEEGLIDPRRPPRLDGS